jgi:catechol 2,3-dioxygenase-like lactoylglutathione lyase family enzyme
MTETLHHVHLFTSDMDETLRFYKGMFGAKVIFDMEMAGARNVLIAIGKGKINFYDQPPRDCGRGVMHHLGIETDDLESLVRHMENRGFHFEKPIRDLGTWKYVMAEAPDSVLLELFQITSETMNKDAFKGFSSLRE